MTMMCRQGPFCILGALIATSSSRCSVSVANDVCQHATHGLQEMYAEYWRGQSEHDAKQSFRMTLMLFQAFDPQDFEDAEAAWYTTRYAPWC